MEILTREQEQKKWWQINHTTRPPQVGNPLSIWMQSGPDIKTYDTEQEVIAHTAEHLSERFRLAYSAPCYCGQLFDDLGSTGDMVCAQQILKGTYNYPPDTDIWTK